MSIPILQVQKLRHQMVLQLGSSEPEFEPEQSNSRIDTINYDTISQLNVL